MLERRTHHTQGHEHLNIEADDLDRERLSSPSKLYKGSPAPLRDAASASSPGAGMGSSSTSPNRNLMYAKALWFCNAMATVGWTRFQNNFYMDNGLTSVQIGELKSIGLFFKFIGDPAISFIADGTDAKTVFIVTIVMQIFTMEILRLSKPLTYKTMVLVKILRTVVAPSSTLTTMASVRLSEGSKQGFGQQRTFGSIAWGVGALLAGFLIDRYGMTSIFYYTYFFNLLNVGVVAYAVPANFNKSSSNILSPRTPNKALLLDETGDIPHIISNHNHDRDDDPVIIDEGTWSERTCRKIFGGSKLGSLMQFLVHPQIRDVLFNSFIYGIVITVPETFFFISLERDYKASRTFTGIATTVSVIACIPLFWYSDQFIKRFGHYRVIAVSQATCVLRLLGYALVQALHVNVYRNHTGKALTVLLAVQLLHGFNFALFVAAGVDLVSKLAPKDLSTSALAVFNVTYMTLGPAMGSLLWGILYDSSPLGVTMVYFAAAFLCGINSFHFFINAPPYIPTSSSLSLTPHRGLQQRIHDHQIYTKLDDMLAVDSHL